MTLLELSAGYRRSAALLHGRIQELRALEKTGESAEDVRLLRQRIATLSLIRREMRELAELTAHYYDRRHDRHERRAL